MSLTVLSVAEKPSVAKEITKHLASGQINTLNSQSRYNPVSEFQSFIPLDNRSCRMVVTSVRGHVMEIDFPEQYRDWQSVDPSTLYDAAIEKRVAKDNAGIARNLQVQARRCSHLILWLDCDREGENISFEVVKICTDANPRLTIRRAQFSAVTHTDIHRAMRNLVDPNQNVADAVDTRQEIDLRIGASFTRFLTMRIQRKFDGFNAHVVSYGPCQFPTLGFIVERWDTIESFVPENFWAIKVVIKKRDTSRNNQLVPVDFSWDRNRLFDKPTVELLHEMCVEEGRATVVNVTHSPATKYKPLPLSTVDMTKFVSRRFRISSHRCMSIAEALYNRGLLSYPRTETNKFPPTMDLPALVAGHTGHSQWGQYAQHLGNGGFSAPRGGNRDDQAHPPIHPVKCAERNEMQNNDEWRIYEFVVRHFLACCSEDARGAKTVVEIQLGGEGFHANGLIVHEKNYLDIYTYDTWTGTQLPPFEANEQCTPTSIDLTEGQTQPPPLLSEADLIEKMDRHGIGTDATMHEHIKTVQDRQYAQQDAQGAFRPTDLGVGLVKGLQVYANQGIDLSKVNE
mmetsp:Transcript_8842/g.25485  ORF Transcript_8842/g.25485 Transcript_8842/m.25485 type:complete len:568 (+) Transcript_8842:189-1892(+)